MRFAKALSLTVVLSSLTTATRAQDVPDLRSGQRVRLTVVGHPSMTTMELRGSIISTDDRHLRLLVPKTKEPLVVDRRDVTRVEISLGQRSRGRGARRGFLVGAAIGAVVGLVSYGDAQDPTFNLAGSAIVAGLLGGATGAIVGVALPPGERWKEAHGGRPGAALMSMRQPGVGLSVSFGF